MLSGFSGLQRKIVGTLFASQSLFSLSMILIISIASIHVVDLAGGDKNWLGVPGTMMLIGSAAAAYPIGRLMDSAGRRVGLSISNILGVAGAALTVWAVIQESLWGYLAGIFVLGLARAGLDMARYAAAEVSPAQLRGRAISLVVMGGTVGSLLGPPLMELTHRLAPSFSLSEDAAPWAMTGVFFALGAIVITLLLRPDPRDIAVEMQAAESDRNPTFIPPRPFRQLIRDWRVQLAIAAMSLSTLSMVVVMTITPVHMQEHHHGETAVTLVMTGHTLGMFGLSFVTGWLVDRFGRTRIIFLGGVLLVVSCLLAPLLTTLAWMEFTLFILGLGWNFGFVAGSTLLDDVLRHSEKGRVQGITEAITRVTSGGGSLGSGFLFKETTYATTSWLTVIIALIPALLVLLYAARRQSSEPLPKTSTLNP
jgi:MFS family permease